MPSAGLWPVLLEGESTVLGEVYILKSAPELLNLLINEELAYGYSLSWRDFSTSQFTGKAITCIWDWQEGFTTIIEHGDWLHYLDQLPANP